MRNYVKMLTEIIEEAKKSCSPSIDMDLLEKQDWFKFMAQEEDEMANPSKTMEQIVGVDRMYFPPEAMLTDEEVLVLYKSIRELWATFHFQPVFRTTTPTRERYEKLLDQWKRVHPFLSAANATWYIELYHEEGKGDDDDFQVE